MAILKLIEKQKALWEIKQGLETRGNLPGRYFDRGVGYGPCLLISRECGSGGAEIARMAGERLGWQVYDREIVDQISVLAHARQQLIESVDERVRSAWETAWRQVLFPEDVCCEKYLCCLHQVISALGHHGDIIILGRGAQYILPRRSALSVRLIAPIEQRVKRVTDLRKLSIPEAKAFVRQRDTERFDFIRQSFHSDATLPLNYDMILNMGEMNIEDATKTILAALNAKLGLGETKNSVPGAV